MYHIHTSDREIGQWASGYAGLAETLVKVNPTVFQEYEPGPKMLNRTNTPFAGAGKKALYAPGPQNIMKPNLPASAGYRAEGPRSYLPGIKQNLPDLSFDMPGQAMLEPNMIDYDGCAGGCPLPACRT